MQEIGRKKTKGKKLKKKAEIRGKDRGKKGGDKKGGEHFLRVIKLAVKLV